MNRIKVLLVSSKFFPEYAGSGFRVMNTYLRLTRRFKLEFNVLCGSEELDGDAVYCKDGINIIRLNCKFFPYKSIVKEKNWLKRTIKYNLKVLLELIRCMCKLRLDKFDLVHVVGKNYITSVGIFLAYVFRKPLIIEYVNYNYDCPQQFSYAHEPFIFKYICKDKPYRRKNTLLVAISPFIRRELEKFQFYNIWERYNPIDSNKFNFKDSNYKYMIRDKISPFKQKDIVLAYIAKWRPSKNHLFLLKLLLKLPERFKVILGGPIVKGGPYFDRDNRILNYAKEFIKNNSLEDRVLLLDKFVENINDYIATSDVYLMPTKEEALGTPLLEAIAVGRPVIANNLVEVWRELAQEIPSLFLIPLDEKAWIESIYNALAIEQEILRSSSKKVLNSFSSEVIDEKYYCILEGLKMGKGYKEILSSV